MFVCYFVFSFYRFSHWLLVLIPLSFGLSQNAYTAAVEWVIKANGTTSVNGVKGRSFVYGTAVLAYPGGNGYYGAASSSNTSVSTTSYYSGQVR